MEWNNMKNYEKYAFKPYPYTWVDDRGVRYENHLIVLTIKNRIVKMTDYHRYSNAYPKVKEHGKQNKDDIRRICNCLNFILFKNFWKYKVKNIIEIPYEAIQDYITTYSRTRNHLGKYSDKRSIQKEIRAISIFMMKMNNGNLSYDKHYYARQIGVKRSSFNQTTFEKQKHDVILWEYELEASYIEENGVDQVRDIPQKAIPVILKWVKYVAPDLYLGVLLQMCAGLRVSEVVNLRRPQSIYPGGIKYSKENGNFTSFEVDLRNEYLLRSDGKSVGSLKKKRLQEVYNSYLKIIQIAYTRHLRLIPAEDIEIEAPLFVTCYRNRKTGKRMGLTKEAYRRRIVRIVRKYVVPELIASNDVELKVFAMKTNESYWGVHSFRHWFSVQLVLNGEDVNGIAYWRGDDSLKTAYYYLRRKGELMKLYTKINNEVADNLFNLLSEKETIHD